MRSSVFVATALMFGCGDSAIDPAAFDAEGALDTADAGEVDSDGGTDDTATDETFVAAWYTLEADVVVADGAGSTTDAAVELVAVDAELAVDERPCSLDLSSLAVAPSPTDAENAGLLAWWTVGVPGGDDCVPDGVPATLGFGIGQLDVEVRARLGTVDLEDEAEDLYGAWLSADDGATVFPFGYTTAPADVSDVALASGAYALRPLLLLALPAPE